jgi:lipopolysaccharide transport system permease protein
MATQQTIRISNRSHTVEREIVIRPSKGWLSLNLAEVWEYRQLLFYFVWRDVKVRYKQTILVPSWAIINPVANLFLFTLIFVNLAKLDSEGIPYPIFKFAAVLPWTFFSGALTNITTSLTGNSTLIQKVYFPRLILPLTAVVGRPDFQFLVVRMMIHYNIFAIAATVVIAVLMLYAAMTSLGIGLWLLPKRSLP